MPDYRKWKYDNSVKEYFVETSTKQTIKHSELMKRVETMDCADAQLHSDHDNVAGSCSGSMNLGCCQEKDAADFPTTVEQLCLVDETNAEPRPEQVGDKAMAG